SLHALRRSAPGDRDLLRCPDARGARGGARALRKAGAPLRPGRAARLGRALLPCPLRRRLRPRARGRARRSRRLNGNAAEIPMQDLALQHEALEPEILAALSKLVASGRFVQGEPVRQFEAELARFCGLPHAVGCNSGTDALWLALRALDVGPGDAVLCPAFSFFASAA